MTTDKELLLEMTGGMTGSAFLKLTRDLAEADRNGDHLSQFQREQVAMAVNVFGADYFYHYN